MTEFITRNYGSKEFEVIIKTDNEEHYKATENFARQLIDHAKPMTNADRIRAMTDEELAIELANIATISRKVVRGWKIIGIEQHILKCLQLPVKK